MSFSFNKGLSRATSRGFTIFEMLVVISIFMIMTGVAIANLPSFRDRTFVDLIAQEIAVTIRQAQTYGIGTRVAGGNSFPSYGVVFQQDYESDPPYRRSLILFADREGGDPGWYNPGDGCGQASTECIEKFIIQGAAHIPYLEVCNPDCEGVDQTGQQSFSILFERPYPEAYIRAESGSSFSCDTCSGVRIHVRSIRNDDNEKVVEVWNTGHIVVKDP